VVARKVPLTTSINLLEPMMKIRGKCSFIFLLLLMATLPAFTQIAAAATQTPSPSATPDGTATPTCIKLTSPTDGTEYPRIGRMTFTWEAQVDANSYQIVFTPPNGKEIRFSTRETRYSRYAESFPWGGEYKWQVVALDGDGKVICTSAFSTFKKPEIRLTQGIVKPEDEEKASGGSGSSGGDEGPPGIDDDQ
jgi:hypothetical protein